MPPRKKPNPPPIQATFQGAPEETPETRVRGNRLCALLLRIADQILIERQADERAQKSKGDRDAA